MRADVAAQGHVLKDVPIIRKAFDITGNVFVNVAGLDGEVETLLARHEGTCQVHHAEGSG